MCAGCDQSKSITTGCAVIGKHRQLSAENDWIINKRKESYEEPEGSYGRGLFAGHTGDPAPWGSGRSFMFNGYMYMGLKAAGELLLAIDNPEGSR